MNKFSVTIFEFIEAIDFFEENLVLQYENFILEKKETKTIEYQYTESVVERILFKDRIHPIDRVIINNFNQKTDSSLEEVNIVYGSGANEYTRSHHALAIVLGNKIYFRNGAYKPETEEGRKLIAHELTHIVQNQNKEKKRDISKQNLEKEAEENEKLEEDNKDFLLTKKIGNKKYTLRKSDWRKIIELSFSKLDNIIEEKERILSETEYLELLYEYKNWLKTGKDKWQIYNK